MPKRVPKSYQLSLLDSHPQHLRGLGLIAAAHAALEDAMCELLSVLIGNPQKAIAIFHTLGSHKARADILRSVVLECVADATAKEEITTLLAKASAKAGLRNDIMHSLWLADPKSGKVAQSLKRPATKNPSVIVHRRAEELVELAIELAEIGHQLRVVAYRRFETYYLAQALLAEPTPRSPPGRRKAKAQGQGGPK
jgi:hypothetical protein